MIDVTNFLARVDEIEAASPSYKLGHDGSDGFCDCIGLIIGAIRRAGGKWPGIHGSNWAARNAMDVLAPLEGSALLKPGDLVYKTRDQSHGSYDLPSRYDGHPDRLDYYHVGVVRSVYPLDIVHCTTPKIKHDTSIKAWSHYGKLSMLDDAETQGKEDEAMEQATVWVENGKPVNIRAKPAANGALIDRAKVGDTVTVLARGGEWATVQYQGLTGYMMDKFLRFAEDDVQVSPDMEERIAELERRVTALEGRRLMEQTLQVEREISELKAQGAALVEQNKTIFSRLDKQDRMICTLNDLALSVRDLTNAQACMQGKVNDLCEDMETIKAKPGRRWESVVDKLLMVAVGAIAGAVLARIGL